MKSLELELEDPNKSSEAWDLVEQEYGNPSSSRKQKIASSFHTNTKAIPHRENSNRFIFIISLAICMGITIAMIGGKIAVFDETNTEHLEKKTIHSSSFGTLRLNESMTMKFYGPIPEEGMNFLESNGHGNYTMSYSKKPTYQSKHPQNVVNIQAHYLHDEKLSPFASELYETYSLGSAEKEQEDYMNKMQKNRDTYGAWNFHDFLIDDRSVVKTYNDYPNRDVPVSDFPEKAWQSDESYMTAFLDESLKLVRRVRDAIIEEYEDKSKKYEETEVKEFLNVNIFEPPHYPVKEGRLGHYKVNGKSYKNGIAWMTQSGYNALVRKLLHSMMTNDDFFVVLAGHSAAAGHGNQFSQSKSMQFHHLMEPIFDKLGMNLITRNMAMGGLGTIQSALGGDAIYGERDFLIWDSSMTENSNDALDVFIRHALMSGERLPIIMIGGQSDNSHMNLRTSLEQTVDGGWWHGDFHNPEGFIAYSDEFENVEQMPFATRGLRCKTDWDPCKLDKFASRCWLDRTDFTPELKQSNKVPSQVSWHPGWRSHRWEARKWSLLMLQALETALTEWREKTSSDGHPLSGEHWHIGDRYQIIREAVIKSTVHDKAEPTCESDIFSFIPRLCRVPFSAATEFTPRADPQKSNIRNLLVPAPNGYIPHLPFDELNMYDGPNLVLPETKIPDGEIDVHAIAIATTEKGSRARRKLVSQRQIIESGNRSLQDKKEYKRKLRNESIVPGRGWYLDNHPAGFCDGTAQSECNRGPNNDCLLYEHNDAHGGLLGDGYSGWLVMKLEGVKEGMVLARIETWRGKEMNPLTKDWTEENNGMTNDTTPYVFPEHFTLEESNSTKTEQNSRRLKGPPPPLPDNLLFEIAVDGEITTWNKDQLEEQRHPVAYNLDMFVLMDDSNMPARLTNEDNDSGATIEVAIRISGIGREATFALTHVYWA